MAEPSLSNIWHEIWDVIKFLLVGVFALFGFSVKKELKRIDKLENDAVKLEIFNAALKALREDFKDLSRNVRDDMREINRKIDTNHKPKE